MGITFDKTVKCFKPNFVINAQHFKLEILIEANKFVTLGGEFIIHIA